MEKEPLEFKGGEKELGEPKKEEGPKPLVFYYIKRSGDTCSFSVISEEERKHRTELFASNPGALRRWQLRKHDEQIHEQKFTVANEDDRNAWVAMEDACGGLYFDSRQNPQNREENEKKIREFQDKMDKLEEKAMGKK